MEIVYSHSKIENFITRLDDVTARHVYKLISRLEQFGYEIRMPYSKSISDGLFELRITGSVQVRILYVFHNNQAILLNIFTKKIWSVPKKEIEYARNILKQYLA